MDHKPIVSAYENEWNPEIIDRYYKYLHQIAVDEWGYEIYPNQLEIVSSEGMMEAYATIGLPVCYPHWSFGKSFLDVQKRYRRGFMSLAYELVINSKPCVNYLMEENTLTTQILVMAHASFGHNHFFKNNYLFRQWTNPEWIIPFCVAAKAYIEECEDRYGADKVEEILDAAHTLRHYCVDKYQKPHKKKGAEEEARLKRLKWEQDHYNPLIKIKDEFPDARVEEPEKPDFDQTENILGFIEQYSPSLKDWERRIVQIVRRIGEYFYPQYHTNVANEGFAVWTHCNLIEELDRRGLVDEAFMMEFAYLHSGVLFQPDLAPPFNPYKLGSAIFDDIKRMCTNPTEEDAEWFPFIVGRPYLDVIKEAVRDFKNESFIQQYLSPKVIRDFRMFTLYDEHPNKVYYEVTAIHDDHGYRKIRDSLSRSHDMGIMVPRIEVYDVHNKSDRRLVLRHHMHRGRPLDEGTAEQVVKHIHRLWGFPVEAHSVDENMTQRRKYLEKGAIDFNI